MSIDETMNLTAEQKQWFHKTFAEWHKVLQPYSGFQPGGLFRSVDELPAASLEGCKVVPQRDYILPDIPTRGKVAEVGTQEGLFAEKILDICKPTELHLFDVDLSPLRKRGNHELLTFAKLYEGDSSTLLATTQDEYFDWIYLDADHSYSAVKKDTEVAMRKVRPGGYILFNDYTIWSPIECIAYGVPYAVHELIIEHGWKMTHLALNKLFYCDVAVRKPI